jgi:hypothetical protein
MYAIRLFFLATTIVSAYSPDSLFTGEDDVTNYDDTSLWPTESADIAFNQGRDISFSSLSSFFDAQTFSSPSSGNKNNIPLFLPT